MSVTRRLLPAGGSGDRVEDEDAAAGAKWRCEDRLLISGQVRGEEDEARSSD